MGDGMIETIRAWMPTLTGRLTFALAFIVALVVGLDPDISRPISWEKLGACVLTGVGWLLSELSDAGKISDTDKALYAEITATLNQQALTFLGQHDFHTNLHIDHTKPITDASYWHGPHYMFSDSRLQRKWTALHEKVIALSELYGTTLTNAPNQVNVLTAWHLNDTPHHLQTQAQEEIKQLNQKSDEVYREYQAFVLFARKRLGL